ncbi:MAG: TIGR02449 family protein [Pseudomonadota bacterium]
MAMEETIQRLEQRVSDLIKISEEMNRENEILRNDQRMLRQEFKALQEKNRIARSRVEQIVARLKSLEA